MSATEGTLCKLYDKVATSTGLPVNVVGGSVNIEATLEIRGESINSTVTNWSGIRGESINATVTNFAGMSGMPVSANITGGSVSIEATLEIRGESINATVTNWSGVRGESINATVTNWAGASVTNWAGIRGESINSTIANWSGASGNARTVLQGTSPWAVNNTAGASITNWAGVRGESLNVTVANSPAVTVNSLRATGVTQFIVNLTNHDTEYALPLPAGTKQINFRLYNTDNPLRFSFGESTCGSSTAPFWVVNAATEKEIRDINFTGVTMYFATGTSALQLMALCYI